MIKKLGKSILCRLLERQVKQLRAQHGIRVIAVCGSVGKTSTKLAIARTIGQRQKVVYQDGNYNDRLTVPLVLFEQIEPAIYDIRAWIKILLQNRRLIHGEYPYKTAVLELGTDAPGQLKAFRYLRPDILVVTAVAAEHMEYFGQLAAVAQEELVPLSYAEHSLLNLDDIPGEYLPEGEYETYGQHPDAVYQLVSRQAQELTGQTLTFKLGLETITIETPLLGSSIAKSLLAAAAVAAMMEWSGEAIAVALKAVKPVAGRMQVLPGLKDSYIIDDSYNASPIAVKAALETLQAVGGSHRVAILGTMNELGNSSASEHQAIGALCDPKQLDLVVTIGQIAGDYLAPAAEKAGCRVMSFMSPYEAGAFVRDELKPGSVVLVKGSQNGVFSEEAAKLLLANPADSSKLVRQSPYWLRVKQEQFPGFK